jgi:dTDP-4-dehydrorhamnose 3,5-epimerase
MNFEETKLKGSYTIDLSPFTDERGWFARYFCKEEFYSIGHEKEWVQMNQSFTYKAGTIRGMHYQLPPYSEIKLVRCIQGKVFDVIIDLRIDSPTFLQWIGEELSAENQKMMYVPEGFAHGFQCITDNCSLLYHHSSFYQNHSEAGIRYDDPMVGIVWPTEMTMISARDVDHNYLKPDFKGI